MTSLTIGALGFLVFFVLATASQSQGAGKMKSEESREEVVIDAPVDFVFPYITEGDKITLWTQDNKLKISFPRGKQARVGMQVRFTIRLPTDPGWTVEIRELVKNEKMMTEFVDGIFRGSISFYLEPIDANHTRLIHEAIIIPQGSFMRFAWEAAGRRIHAVKVKELMQQIKTIVEKDVES
jgi:uncharacterized protein YndB with AHSA1/START domain